MTTAYFKLGSTVRFIRQPEESAHNAVSMIAVTTDRPADPETPPSPYMSANIDGLNLLDVTQPYGRIELARFIADIPLYRLSIELLVDEILLKAQTNPVRAKGVRAAFAPDDPPEAVDDPMTKYGFAGALHYPLIATRTEAQLIDVYLRLFGPACPEHTDIASHIEAMLGGYPVRFAEKYDGLIWKGEGWIRLDRMVYEAERLDYDPEITFESYVTRGRAAAQMLHVTDPKALLAAWLSAERIQHELCRDIDAVLRLPDVRKLPRWIRADVFRLLEREAMKQVFAESLVQSFSEWTDLRHARILSEPIEANGKGEVAPLIQQLMNQTLSVDSSYAGAGEAFALASERRMAEARRLLR